MAMVARRAPLVVMVFLFMLRAAEGGGAANGFFNDRLLPLRGGGDDAKADSTSGSTRSEIRGAAAPAGASNRFKARKDRWIGPYPDHSVRKRPLRRNSGYNTYESMSSATHVISLPPTCESAVKKVKVPHDCISCLLSKKKLALGLLLGTVDGDQAEVHSVYLPQQAAAAAFLPPSLPLPKPSPSPTATVKVSELRGASASKVKPTQVKSSQVKSSIKKCLVNPDWHCVVVAVVVVE